MISLRTIANRASVEIRAKNLSCRPTRWRNAMQHRQIGNAEDALEQFFDVNRDVLRSKPKRGSDQVRRRRDLAPTQGLL